MPARGASRAGRLRRGRPPLVAGPPAAGPVRAPLAASIPWASLRRAWPVGRWILGLGLAGFAAWLVAGQRDELSGATRYLAQLRWWWLLAATAVEVGSYLALAGMQRTLLRCGGLEPSAARLTGVSLAATSMQNSLPAGAAFAAAFTFRQYRRLGADDVLAGWALVAGVGMSFVAVSALAGVGLVVAFGAGSALDLVQAVAAVVAVAALLLLGWTRRAWLVDHSVTVVHLAQRLTGRPRGDASARVASVHERLAALTPDRRTWMLAGAGAAANWLLDLGCLAVAFLAVGADLPWRGLLLAYSAGQLAAMLPVTPGGLGVVEGSLTVALVAFGGGEASAVAAVLVYRLVSFWGELPAGWGAAAALARWPVRPSGHPAAGEGSAGARPAVAAPGAIEPAATGSVPVAPAPGGADQ